MREGAGCVGCDVVAHKKCAAVCPKCSQAFLPSNEIHAMLSPLRKTDRERPRGVTVLAKFMFVGVPLGVFSALGGFFLFASEPSAAFSTITMGGISAIVSAALGSALLKGLAWSRRFVLWTTPFLLAADFATGVTPRSDFQSARFALEAGTYCVWAFVLTRPKAVEFFKRSQHESTVAA